MEEHQVDRWIRESKEQSEREAKFFKTLIIFIFLSIICIGIFGITFSFFQNICINFINNIFNFFNK